VIQFQESLRLGILTATKNFISNDQVNFVPYKYEYIKEQYLLFVSGRTILNGINYS
jgi:hypothetical protein